MAAALYQWEEAARAKVAPEAEATQPPSEGKTPSPVASPPADAPKGDASAGKGLFEAACGVCHPKGEKGVGPALTGPDFAKKYPADPPLISLTRKGIGGMPGFSPQRLSDKEVADIIAYVRSLVAPQPVPSPTVGQSPTPPSSSPTLTPTSSPALSGRALYESKCALCHKPPDPKAFSRWGPAYFDSMATLANLSPEQRDTVLRFLREGE